MGKVVRYRWRSVMRTIPGLPSAVVRAARRDDWAAG
jgi:hypothetical protein